MRKIGIVCAGGLLLFALTIAPTPALALLTTIDPAPFGEVTLYGYGGILDDLYGWDNLVRVDDNSDQIWQLSGGDGTATVRAKYAKFSQWLYAGSDYLFTVTGRPVPGHPLSSPSVTFSTPGYFAFYNDPNGPGVDPVKFSSMPSQNAGKDRMVTWKITDGNSAGNYVMGWEDAGDNDFNDIVYEFSNIAPTVPEPASMLLLGIGLIGLAGGKVRKRFKA